MVVCESVQIRSRVYNNINYYDRTFNTCTSDRVEVSMKCTRIAFSVCSISAIHFTCLEFSVQLSLSRCSNKYTLTFL